MKAFGHSQLVAASLDDDSAPIALTTGRFNDSSPSFTPDGRYLGLSVGSHLRSAL